MSFKKIQIEVGSAVAYPVEWVEHTQRLTTDEQKPETEDKEPKENPKKGR